MQLHNEIQVIVKLNIPIIKRYNLKKNQTAIFLKM